MYVCLGVDAYVCMYVHTYVRMYQCVQLQARARARVCVIMYI